MPRSEDIVNSIWRELDPLPNDAMLLYLWSWTNERCGMAGIYSCPRRLLLEARLDDDALDAALQALRERDLLLYEDDVVWCVARVKRLRTKSSQIAAAIATDLAEIDPANPLHGAFIERYDGMPWGKEGEAHLNLTRGSPEPRPRLKRGSSEPQASLKNGSGKGSGRGSSEAQASLTGKGNGNGLGKGNGNNGSTARVGLSETAPPPIREALPVVLESLGRISETRGFPFPDEARVLAALVTYPDADHRAVVSDMEDWLCSSKHGRRQQVRDLVQTLRNQLDRKQGNGKAPRADAEPSEYDDFVEADSA